VKLTLHRGTDQGTMTIVIDVVLGRRGDFDK
jgi:hypothetical protein